MPPVFITALTTGLVAMIPKALSDAYDYFFNGEEIQVKKIPDRTPWTREHVVFIKHQYQQYSIGNLSYKTQDEFTDFINNELGLNKSTAQVIRIAKHKA